MGKMEDDSKTGSTTTGYRYNYHPQEVQHVKPLNPVDKRRDAYMEHRQEERYPRPPEHHGQSYPKAPKQQHGYPWPWGTGQYGGGSVYGYPPPMSAALPPYPPPRHDIMLHDGGPAMYFPSPPAPGDMAYGKAAGTPVVNAKWYDKSVAALKKEKPQRAGTYSASFYQFVPLDPKDGKPEQRLDIDLAPLSYGQDSNDDDDDDTSRHRFIKSKTYPYVYSYVPGQPPPGFVHPYYPAVPPPHRYRSGDAYGYGSVGGYASVHPLGGRAQSIVGSVVKDDKTPPPHRDVTTNSYVTHPPKPYGETACGCATPAKQQKLELHFKEPVMADDEDPGCEAARTRRRRAYQQQHLHHVTDNSGSKPVPAGAKNRSTTAESAANNNAGVTGLVLRKKLYDSESDDEDSDC